MKKIIMSLILVIVATGCSNEMIPPAHKGKILSTAGYMPEILEPGKYRLWGYDEMVLLETSTNTVKETMEVIMQDKLTLAFDVRFRSRIDGSEKVMSAMFNDISPVAGEKGMKIISMDMVYNVYGRMLVRNKAREVISNYTVDDVHKNYARISGEIAQQLYKAFESTPLKVSDVALGNIKYPEVVTQAVNLAEERRLAIERERAQAEIDLTKKENEKRLAKAEYEIQITKAKAIRDQNKLISEGITPQLLEYRKWEVMEKLQDNPNAVYLPYESLQSPGVQMKMYK